ncbi:unnamed protein product [Phytophthora fragariaefolia]|uniref:Unnamed protein product n=1 Tax=Phytophthora fragariaefolia TaxID=1490495 RepID=A0A9W6TGW1_9STRA|nr:unnamed protein product [Phytophthora fragariaefolia]
MLSLRTPTLNATATSLRFFSELAFGNNNVVALELIEEGNDLGSLQRHQHKAGDDLAGGTTERARDGSRVHEPLAVLRSNMGAAVRTSSVLSIRNGDLP